jgi:hypothetical protein
MEERFERDSARIDLLREACRSRLRNHRTITLALFCLAAAFEVVFFVLMLVFMDFRDRTHWFILFCILFVYCPLVTMTLRNAFKIDELFYRLVDELRSAPQTD